MRVAADLGTYVDRGKKGTDGMDKDVVVDWGSEWGDIGCGVVGDITVKGDEAEEVPVYEFFLGVPKFLVILVNDGVLVWMAVISGGTSRGRKELGKEGGSNSIGQWFDGKRWERSGWLQSGGMG